MVKLTEHFLLLFIPKTPNGFGAKNNISWCFFLGNSYLYLLCHPNRVCIDMVQTICSSVRPSCAATENHRTDLHEIWYWEFYRKLSRHLNCGQTRTNTKTLYMDAAWLSGCVFNLPATRCETKESCDSFETARSKFVLM